MTKTLTSREQDDMFRLGQADVFGSFLKSIVQNGELKHFDCNILLENALGDSPNPLEMLKVLIQNLPQKEIANFTAALFLPHKEAISGMELVMEKHPDLFHFLNGMDPHKRRRPLHTAFYFFDDKRDKESREHNKQLALWLLEKGALCTSRMVLDIALLDEDIAPFLAHIPNLNLMSEGHLPLHAAATQGRRLSNVEALIDAGADVNARDEKGRTALLCAESPDMVELLLKKGADPLAVDFQGHNLLMVILKDKPTSLGGVVDVLSEVCPQHLDALFAHRGFDGSTVLHHIARQPLPPVFQTFDLPAFLQTPRGSALLDAKDAQGTTPLIASSSMGLESTSVALIAAGADMNIQNHMGSTALMEATLMGHQNMCKSLLLHGADANLVNRSGETALDIAAQHSIALPCVPYLIAMGTKMAEDPRLLSDQNKKNLPKNNNESVLISAMRTNDAGFLQFVLKQKDNWPIEELGEAKKYAHASSKRSEVAAVIHSHLANVTIQSVLDKSPPAP